MQSNDQIEEESTESDNWSDEVLTTNMHFISRCADLVTINRSSDRMNGHPETGMSLSPGVVGIACTAHDVVIEQYFT